MLVLVMKTAFSASSVARPIWASKCRRVSQRSALWMKSEEEVTDLRASHPVIYTCSGLKGEVSA